MRIAIVGAMDVEIDYLKDNLELEDELKKAGMRFYQGRLAGVEVVVVKSGIAKVNAAICTQILVDEFKVDKLIFTGVAGAIDPKLEVGDIVIGEDLIQHDVDASGFGYQKGEIPGLDTLAFKADKELVKLAYQAGKELSQKKSLKIYQGRILSGDQFISDNNKVKKLKAEFGGYCTEMEGAALAQACYLNDLPFVVIRSISDKADQEANLSFEEFVAEAAANSYNIVLEMLKAKN